MWTYYLLFISAIPVLGELFLSFTFWVMPLKQSGAATTFVLAMWMVVVFYIVRKMSRPVRPFLARSSLINSIVGVWPRPAQGRKATFR